jgi:hypothetical protein
MITIPHLPPGLQDEISNPVSIITHEYKIIYTNSAFKNIFPIARGGNRKTPIREFEELRLHQQGIPEPSVNKKLFFPDLGRNCYASVYLLNGSLDTRHYLLLVKSTNHDQRSDHAESEIPASPFADEEEIYAERAKKFW